MRTIFKATDPVTKTVVSLLEDGTVEAKSPDGSVVSAQQSPTERDILRELIRLKLTYEAKDLEDIPVDTFTANRVIWEIFSNGDYRLTQDGSASRRHTGTELTQRIAQILSVATPATLRKISELKN